MSRTQAEMEKNLRAADVIPHKHGGKIRVSCNPKTPTPTKSAAIEVVRKFAHSMADNWKEPTTEDLRAWERDKRELFVVCDDPLPKGVDIKDAKPSWLVSKCTQYRLIIKAVVNSNLELDIEFEAADGWKIDQVIKHLPEWLLKECKSRRAEIVEFVHQTGRESGHNHESEPSGGDELTEGESCKVCLATIYTHSPEIQRMCHMVNCPYWTPESQVGPEWMERERSSMAYREKRDKANREAELTTLPE